eukprot:816950-Rhodomonas_salina.3
MSGTEIGHAGNRCSRRASPRTATSRSLRRPWRAPLRCLLQCLTRGLPLTFHHRAVLRARNAGAADTHPGCGTQVYNSEIIQLLELLQGPPRRTLAEVSPTSCTPEPYRQNRVCAAHCAEKMVSSSMSGHVFVAGMRFLVPTPCVRDQVRRIIEIMNEPQPWTAEDLARVRAIMRGKASELARVAVACEG